MLVLYGFAASFFQKEIFLLNKVFIIVLQIALLTFKTYLNKIGTLINCYYSDRIFDSRMIKHFSSS